MEQTQFIVRIGVAFTAEGYEQAEEILDAIDRKVGKVLAGHGQHDITAFETRPCKAARFDQRAQAMGRGDMVAREFDPDRDDRPMEPRDR